jgi:predicted TIM-barrel fold metal-dependent hydrolase
MQVLSLNSPGIQAEIDSQVAIRKRFAGWAALPLQDPSAAANELERTVRDDGFCGAHINGHCLGKYLDHPDFLMSSGRGRLHGTARQWLSPRTRHRCIAMQCFILRFIC